ncbi:MAG: 50S ribosomal protein L29 [Planctomycetota bacterium]
MKIRTRLKEMREKDDAELRFDLKELQRELFDLRFKSSAEGLSNPSRIRAIRHDVARIRTLLREREKSIRGAQPRT